jgi:hypothetical protein
MHSILATIFLALPAHADTSYGWLVGRGLTPDRFTVTPPEGFIAVPAELDVAEDQTGVILVVPWLGY